MTYSRELSRAVERFIRKLGTPAAAIQWDAAFRRDNKTGRRCPSGIPGIPETRVTLLIIPNRVSHKKGVKCFLLLVVRRRV